MVQARVESARHREVYFGIRYAYPQNVYSKSNKIVVGRDARISGEMVKNVVVGTLMGMGWDVVDIDLASTPTTELAVTMEGASGGIILTDFSQSQAVECLETSE